MSVDIDIGTAALSDYDEDNHLQIQIDAPGIDGKEGTQPAEALSPNGVHARPLDPDKGGSDSAIGLGEGLLIITIGDRRYVLPIGDPRDVAEGKVPKLKKGGKQLVGGAGEHRSFINIDGLDPKGAKKSGSVMISASYSKGGAKKSLGLSFNVRDEGKEDISLVHGDGARVTIDKKGTTITSPSGKNYVGVADDGVTLAGSVKIVGSVTAGDQLAGLPLAKGPELVALLSSIIATMAASVTGAPGVPTMPAAGALAAGVPTILTKHVKGT